MNDLFLEVYRRMSEPHRKYHTFNHICEMFQYAHARCIELTDAQVHAIALHDIVYEVPADPKRSNEEKSAIAADVILTEMDLPEDYIDTVCRIILDTEKELPTIEESKIVIDLDLAGLAHKYWENKNLIREEYGHLNDDEFNAGRIKWLESMLSRDSIFVSGRFYDIEEKAVANLKAELQLLRG